MPISLTDLKNPFNLLLLLIPLVLAGEYLFHMDPVWIFFLACGAILPLAKWMGDATEELSIHAGPGIGGLLNATFGNATELIIALFAINAGLFNVVKASITGAVIGNILLVLGFAILMGGLKREKQVFNKTIAQAGSGLLMLAVIGLVVPAVFAETQPHTDAKVLLGLSIATAVVMIVIYGLSLLFSLKTHRHLGKEDHKETEEEAKWSVKMSVFILAATSIGVAFMSEALVSSIEPVIQTLGWTELFIGIILIPIIGNTAEHWTAVTMAMKNKMDLAMNVAIGSSLQIALFVAPVLVFASILFGKPMNLVFEIFEVAAIMAAVAILNIISADGESNWLEGAMLLGAYIILAAAFFFYN